MIRRITDVSSPAAQSVFALRQRFLTEHPHEVFTPMEQVVAGTAQGLFQLLSIEIREGKPVGFAMLHPYHWAGTPVQWLDEVYIEPGSRGKGLFEQFVAWCGHYCQVSGVPVMMTNAWTKAEGAPFAKHVGTEPVVLTLRMVNPTYSATHKEEVKDGQHTDPDTIGNGKLKAPRKKPAVHRRVTSHRLGDSPGVSVKTGE